MREAPSCSYWCIQWWTLMEMIGYFLRKYQITVKNVPVMHNYVNVSIIMHATGTSLFGFVGLKITKAHVKFWFNPISSFCEKVEQTKKQKNKVIQYNIKCTYQRQRFSLRSSPYLSGELPWHSKSMSIYMSIVEWNYHLYVSWYLCWIYFV